MADKNIQNTSQLRQMLIDTIQQVKGGTLEPTSARTIAALSSTILQSAKVDLDYLKFHAQHRGKPLGDGEQPLNLISERPLNLVHKDMELNRVIDDAVAELIAWRDKYASYKQVFAVVFTAIELVEDANAAA